MTQLNLPLFGHPSSDLQQLLRDSKPRREKERKRERGKLPGILYAGLSSVFTGGSTTMRLTVGWLISGGGLSRPKMTLNLDAGGNAAGTSCAIPCGGLLALKKPGGLNLGLPLEISTARISADLVDVELPLERQGWVCRVRRFSSQLLESWHAVKFSWLENH